ncbi:hypothetical protein [Pseudoclavibacter sp. VKM Ac-2867]|uniref:hypothetical protein n=1 Tax=Pseudoclavibacter sp. VKM Ac-2867 TaxID=2783829 RepID=UPI00188A7E15|nr:hypothetical protein [Pseudoclavibacter sp. VKM Ac-2867]MBF4460616.1 hypothetical protein [Pseudoclavibacter sp. VKM Ac-2867]
MGIGRLIYRALLPAALFLAAWQFVGWLILGAPVGRLFVFGFAGLAAVAGLLILSANFWLRPDIRESKALQPRDVPLIVVPWLLWAVGAVVPDAPGLWVLAAAFLSMVVAGSIARRRLTAVVQERLAAAQTAGPQANPFGLFGGMPGMPTPGMPGASGRGGPPAGGGGASGPDAGKIITLDPDPEERS